MPVEKQDKKESRAPKPAIRAMPFCWMLNLEQDTQAVLADESHKCVGKRPVDPKSGLKIEMPVSSTDWH
jgi:hypothetical protein